MDDERFEITYRICYELDKVEVTYDDVRMNLDGNGVGFIQMATIAVYGII